MADGSEAPASCVRTAEHEAAPGTPPFTKAEDLGAYRAMLLIRRFEERAGQLCGMGLIGGFCPLCIGREAVVVGLRMAMAEGDSVVAGPKSNGYALACGVDADGLMAELTGRGGGQSRGKGGAGHVFDPGRGFFGGHDQSGAQVPLGTGLALAAAYRGDGRASLVALDAAAADRGEVRESLAMARSWRLPAVYVIEDAPERIAPDLGFPVEPVDGTDVRAVRAAGARAFAHARSGSGPFLLEMRTDRYRGHATPGPDRDPGGGTRTRDPIERVRRRLLDAHGATEAELRAIDAAVRGIVGEAAAFAADAPEPDPRELWTDVEARP